MRFQVVLVVTLAAVLGVLAALPPLGEGTGGSSSSWPCCDDCGVCNRKLPPDCQCKDISVHGCRPECNKCVRNTVTADGGVDDGSQKRPGQQGGHGPVVTYRCADMVTNFCKRRCTPAPAAAAVLGGVL